MRFVLPGNECAFCACRLTKPTKHKGLEAIAAFFIPFVVHRCPHCLRRFWRLSYLKLVIQLAVLIIVGYCWYRFSLLAPGAQQKPLRTQIHRGFSRQDS